MEGHEPCPSCGHRTSGPVSREVGKTVDGYSKITWKAQTTSERGSLERAFPRTIAAGWKLAYSWSENGNEVTVGPEKEEVPVVGGKVPVADDLDAMGELDLVTKAIEEGCAAKQHEAPADIKARIRAHRAKKAAAKAQKPETANV